MSRRIQFNSLDFDADMANITASGNATSAQLQAVRQRLDALRAAIASTSELARLLPTDDGEQQDAGIQTLVGGAGTTTMTGPSVGGGSSSASDAAGVLTGHPGTSRASTRSPVAASDRIQSRSEALQRNVSRIRAELAERTAVADRLYASEAQRVLTETEAAAAEERARTVDDILARWVQLDDAGFSSASSSASTPRAAGSSLAAAATIPGEQTRIRAWRSEYPLTRDETSYLRLRGPGTTASSSSASSSGSVVPPSARNVRQGSSNSHQTGRVSQPAPTIVDFNQRRSAPRSSMAMRGSLTSSITHGYPSSVFDNDSPETTRALIARVRRNGATLVGSGPSSAGDGDGAIPVPGAPLPRRRRRTASSGAVVPATAVLPSVDSDVHMGGITSTRMGDANQSTPHIPLAYGPLEDFGGDPRLRHRLLRSAQIASDANGRIQALRDRYLHQFASDGQSSSSSSSARSGASTTMPSTAMELPLSEELEGWFNSAPSMRYSKSVCVARLECRCANFVCTGRRTRTSQASQTRPPVASDSSWRTRMEFLTSTVNLPLSDSGSQATTRPVSPIGPTSPPMVFLRSDPVEIMALPQSIEETLDTISADDTQQTDAVRWGLEEGALYW